MVGSVTVTTATPSQVQAKSDSFTHSDTEPDRSRPVAERLYQVGRGNRR